MSGVVASYAGYDVNVATQSAKLAIENKDTNWILHKIAHAATGCAAGALQKQCEAGAIGAAVGEVVAELMPTSDPNLPTLEFQHIQNKNRELAKLMTGVIAAYTGYDVETAVKTADTAIANNRQLHAQEIEILKQEAKLFARSRGISSNEAEIVLYSWVYAQLDTKANNKLNAYLTELASYISGIDYYPNFNPKSDYANLIKHFEAADVVYKKLVEKHGAKPLKDAANHVIKMNNNPVLMFKSTNRQLDNSGAFGARLGNDNLGISEALNGNSGRANQLIQSNANNYFESKLQSYQAHHLHTSGQVNPVYPEDIFGAVKAIRYIGRLALTTLRQKGVSAAGRNANVAKATCTTDTYCFTAGTLIETSEGLKAIETFTGGELIWTRNDITLEYGYRPVVATKATPNQPIFQVTVKNHQGDIETLQTTAEHPFWIKDTGWLKASLLEQGMILLDRNNQEVEVISQYLLPNHTNTVYNIEVDDFHTYHVGRLGVWVHNADCCENLIHSIVKQDELLLREARKLSQQESQGINQMMEKIKKGNENTAT